MTGAFRSAEEAAAHWVARMDADNWCAADEQALQRWLAEDGARRGLLLRTQATWLAADKALAAPAAPPLEEAGVFTGAPRWQRRAVLGGLAAASVAGIAGLSRLFTPETSYATGLGEIRRVPLADGSVMTINSGSALKVRMDARSRLVELSHGEAWFEVAKDAARPFIVSAARVQAQAIGTAFSVRMRDAGVEVLVTEGIVETRCETPRGEVAASRTRLTAGQRAVVTENAAVHYEADKPSSVDRALAWRGGMIDLEGETLAEAAAEFNRYNERKIVIADAQIGSEQLDGIFRINDPEGFANAVKTGLNASVNTDDPAVIRIAR